AHVRFRHGGLQGGDFGFQFLEDVAHDVASGESFRAGFDQMNSSARRTSRFFTLPSHTSLPTRIFMPPSSVGSTQNSRATGGLNSDYQGNSRPLVSLKWRHHSSLRRHVKGHQPLDNVAIPLDLEAHQTPVGVGALQIPARANRQKLIHHLFTRSSIKLPILE